MIGCVCTYAQHCIIRTRAPALSRVTAAGKLQHATGLCTGYIIYAYNIIIVEAATSICIMQ